MKRRDFLRLSALGAASLQAKELGSAEQALFDKKSGLSANKFGAFYVRTIAGRVVETVPFEGDAYPNELNNAVIDYIQNESRVKYPFVRKSFLSNPNNPKPELRVKEEFVRVSWDEAIKLSAKILKENFDKYGAEAIYGQVYQWGSLGKVGHSQKTAKRLLNVLGGYVNELGGYSYGAATVILPHITGFIDPTLAPTKWEAILKNAKTIVFWGTNPVVSNKIAIGVPLHNSYKYYDEIRKKGESGEMKIYSVDVYHNESARYFGAKYLEVVSCTDTAMMIGMCNYVFEKGLYSKEFIEKYTVGFDKFKEYMLGTKDGVNKNLAWASKICGVSEQDLAKFSEDLVKNDSVIVSGYAIQRQDHGEMAYWALVTLNAMLGHIGKEGCGFVTNDGMHKNADESYIAPKLAAFETKVPQNSLIAALCQRLRAMSCQTQGS